MLSILCAALLAFTSGDGSSGGDQPAAKIEVVCKPQALIRGTRILIADLADILPPGTTAHRIGQIPFGARPASGFSRVVSKHEILQCMVMAGEDAGRLKMTGALEVVVQPAFTEIRPRDIRDSAAVVLRAAIAKEQSEEEVEFDLVTRLKHIRVPPGREGVDYRARVRDGQIGMTRAIVDLSILVDDEVYKVVPIQYKLRRYHQILKISRTIRKNEPFTQANLELVRQEVSQASGLYLQSYKEALGKVARRNLQPNRVLYLGDVMEPAIVYRGQLVTVVAANRRVKVTIQGIANQNGAKGDVIYVTNQSTNRIISAVVYAPGVVIVPNTRR